MKINVKKILVLCLIIIQFGLISAASVGKPSPKRVKPGADITLTHVTSIQLLDSDDHAAIKAKKRKKKYQDPVVKEKALLYQRKKYQDPVAREKKLEYQRKRNKKPEVMAKRLEYDRRRRQDPVIKAAKAAELEKIRLQKLEELLTTPEPLNHDEILRFKEFDFELIDSALERMRDAKAEVKFKDPISDKARKAASDKIRYEARKVAKYASLSSEIK